MFNFIFTFILIFSANNSFTFHEKLNSSYEKGEISLEQKILLGEMAIKTPEKLPVKWSKILKEFPINLKSGTPYLVDAFQMKTTKGYKSQYSYPDAMAFYLDSDTFPIRVYYDDESLHDRAVILLEGAEFAWQKEVVDWGFYAPVIDTDYGRYPIYLGNAQGAAGYTAPMGVWDATEWDDCVTYIVIESSLDDYYLRDTVAHEMSHSQQASMDCMEPSAFWENTAVFMETAVYQQSIHAAAYMSESFQQRPYKSVSGGDRNDIYWYGGYMWPMWLASSLGTDARDAVLVRQIWEASMQNSGFTWNNPNYMQAIDAIAESKGSTMHKEFHKFSYARYFVDTEYSSEFSTLPNAEVIHPAPPLAGTITMAPERNVFRPSTSFKVEPYGVNYIKLKKPADYTTLMKVSLVTTGDRPWYLQIIPLDGVDHTPLVSGDGTQTPTITFDPAVTGDVLVIVERLYDDTFNPSSIAQGDEYSLVTESALSSPLITMLSPKTMKQGELEFVKVYGSDFLEGAQIIVGDGSEVAVMSTVVSSANQIVAKIQLDEDAAPGLYDVTIINSDGASYTLPDAFEVIEVKHTTTGGGSGFGCSSSNTTGTTFPLSLLLLLIPIFLRKLF